MICRDDINLAWGGSWAFSGQHITKRRDSKLGIEMETYTPKRKDGSFGKGKTFFFIDGDEREFTDLDSLIDAYNEKFVFEDENPEYIVEYIKIIRKRKV